MANGFLISNPLSDLFFFLDPPLAVYPVLYIELQSSRAPAPPLHPDFSCSHTFILISYTAIEPNNDKD